MVIAAPLFCPETPIPQGRPVRLSDHVFITTHTQLYEPHTDTIDKTVKVYASTEAITQV